MPDSDSDGRRIWVGRSITIGNFISPLLTIAVIGTPALIWGGRIDNRVEYLAGDVLRNMSAIRGEMESTRVATNAMSGTLVMMSTTLNEGIKQGMVELSRRVVSLETKAERQADEINKLQIELATIRRASEPAARAR